MADAGATSFYGQRLELLRQQDAEALRSAAKRKTILSEDEYVSCMDAIIVRDFFPDLPNLRARLEYLDALEGQNAQRLADAEERLLELGTPVTPAGMTPGQRRAHGPPLNAPAVDIDAAPTLDKFLARFTSEDNASFDEIHARMLEAHRAKHWWTDPAEHKRRMQLLGPNGEARASIAPPLAVPVAGSGAGAGALTVKGDTRPTTLDFAPTQRTNALFFQPAGVAHGASSGAAVMGPPKALVARRTRFSSAQLSSLRTLAPAEPGGRAGGLGDGAASLGPVPSTPALTPGGAGESPLMTWGQVAATPLLLHPLDVPLLGDDVPHAQRYRIPAQPRREAVSHELATAATCAAARRPHSVARAASAPHSRGPSRAPTPKTLSAAAAKLAAALGRVGSASRHELGFNSELRASYGGATPRAPTSHVRTPHAGSRLTPRAPPVSTPTARGVHGMRCGGTDQPMQSSAAREQSVQPSGSSGKRPRTVDDVEREFENSSRRHAAGTGATLTDGLLQI